MIASVNALSEVEARVLGALVEKELTTPEYYPLSLNALVNACNQKSNRDPVMSLDEDAVNAALRNLDKQGLAGRAVRRASADRAAAAHKAMQFPGDESCKARSSDVHI